MWWPDIAGLVINKRTDWADVAKLVTASYRARAPKRLAATVAKAMGQR